MPIISGGGSGGLPGVTVSGAAAASKALIATSSSAASWAYPPGFEIGYDQITANVNITGTSAAAATTIITCAAHTFDGGAVLLEAFTPLLLTPTGGFAILVLIESGSVVTQLGSVNGIASAQAGNPVTAHLRFTPSAGSHTYLLGAYAQSTTGTPAVQAGTGSGDVRPPAFMRFTKV